MAADRPGLAQRAENGYVAVNQDSRGTFRSQGTFNPFFQEQSDGYDAVEWAAAQSWSTGKVAMTGVSYFGVTQWQAAVTAPPHLVAIAPGALNQNRDWPVTTEYRALLGGVFRRMYSLDAARLDRVFPNAVPRDLGLI